MKIKYLGTAAAEGIPSMFCTCKTCMKSWESGGRNFRTRSQALIDDKLLIDFNADTYTHELKYGFRLYDINTILITHIHDDHYYPQDFSNRKPGFSYMDNCKPLNVYGSVDLNEPIINRAVEACTCSAPNQMNVIYIKPFEPFEREGYTITAIKAAHGTDNPYNYIISKDGKTMLYAHDTSYYDDETWEYIKNNVGHFDFVSMDCTAANVRIRYIGHMNFERNIEFRNKLISLGCADESTIFIANHFSHNGGCTYDEMIECTKEMPFDIAYDGMEIEF